MLTSQSHSHLSRPANLSANFQQQYNQLFDCIKAKSFQKGDFILASGKRSNYYIDCRTTTLSAEGAYLIGQLLYALIEPHHIDSVGGVLMGAAPMVSAISYQSALHGQAIDGFLIRKAPKDHGTSKQVEGHVKNGDRVVLVEDVVSTGGSLIKGIDALQREYPDVTIAKVFSLVDRNLGGNEALTARQIPYQALYSVDAFLQE